MGKLIFITGGVRSGKSRRALELAEEAGGSALFVATALASDPEMVERIDRHRAERPGGWRTAEALLGKLADAFASNDEEVLLLDCLGLYVSRRLVDGTSSEEVAAEVREAALTAIEEFELSVFVSNEVGWGLVPDNELGRLFIESLGPANRQVAGLADEVLLMVSGIPLRIK